MASGEEWYKIVERGLRLGLMDTVDEADIFRDHNGKLVLNGAMGVPRLKRLPDGSTVELQRFISNLVPMSAYFRRLRGDSSLLPPLSRLGLIVLDEGETLEMDFGGHGVCIQLVSHASGLEELLCFCVKSPLLSVPWW